MDGDAHARLPVLEGQFRSALAASCSRDKYAATARDQRVKTGILTPLATKERWEGT